MTKNQIRVKFDRGRIETIVVLPMCNFRLQDILTCHRKWSQSAIKWGSPIQISLQLLSDYHKGSITPSNQGVVILIVRINAQRRLKKVQLLL